MNELLKKHIIITAFEIVLFMIGTYVVALVGWLPFLKTPSQQAFYVISSGILFGVGMFIWLHYFFNKTTFLTKKFCNYLIKRIKSI